MANKTIKLYNRKSIYADLNEFDFLAKKDDFIEITEWHNGEGIDITINEDIMALTWGQLKAIKKLSKKLYGNND